MQVTSCKSKNKERVLTKHLQDISSFRCGRVEAGGGYGYGSVFTEAFV